MEDNRDNFDQPLQEIIYCSRCKLNEADVTCAMCDPYKYFCNDCNEQVHLVPSKKFHVRRKIQDKTLDSLNNNSVNESKIKASSSSNFKLSENFNKDKFLQVAKDNNSEIKKAFQNFEFDYSNNRFYNKNNYNNVANSNYEKCREDTNSNEYTNYNKKLNFNYSSNQDKDLNNQDIVRYDRGRMREKNYYSTFKSNTQNENFLKSNVYEKERNNNSHNNSLQRSQEMAENRASKSRDNSRRFYNFKRNNQESSFSKSPTKSTMMNSNNDINQNIGSNNYLNEIKKIYDKERDELTNKNFEIEKRYQELKLGSEQEIFFFKNKLEETVEKYETEIAHINEENELFLKKVLTEKDQEIRIIHLKYKELETINQELLMKNNEYASTLQKLKHGFTDKLSDFDLKSKQQNKEIIDLKAFYEDKIAYMTDSFNIEKSKLISENDRNIEKLVNGHKESKDKLNNIIKQKEEDISELKENHKIEQEKKLAEIEALNKDLKKAKDEKKEAELNAQDIENKYRNIIERNEKISFELQSIKIKNESLNQINDEIKQQNELDRKELMRIQKLHKGNISSISRGNSLNTSKVKNFATKFQIPAAEKFIHHFAEKFINPKLINKNN